jgi:hypothetical protein
VSQQQALCCQEAALTACMRVHTGAQLHSPPMHALPDVTPYPACCLMWCVVLQLQVDSRVYRQMYKGPGASSLPKMAQVSCVSMSACGAAVQQHPALDCMQSHLCVITPAHTLAYFSALQSPYA